MDKINAPHTGAFENWNKKFVPENKSEKIIKQAKCLNTHFDPIGHKKVDESRLVYNEDIGHYVVIPEDDGEPVTFKWHFTKGILSPRMSGHELATFVLHHMSAIIAMGLMDGHPRVKQEFEAMFVQLATQPKEVLDRLLPWIKVEMGNQRTTKRKDLTKHEGDDDIIYMSLFAKTPQKSGHIFSLPQ